MIEELRELEIGSSVHFIPLHMHPYWRETYSLSDSDFPHATRAFGQEISLPIYPFMDDEQLSRAVTDVPRAYELACARAHRSP